MREKITNQQVKEIDGHPKIVSPDMPQRFLPRIESMRGIAALTVVGFHVSNPFSAGPAFGWFDGFAFWILTALLNGFGAVVVFFVLSGFVLARSTPIQPPPGSFAIASFGCFPPRCSRSRCSVILKIG